jgi:hypothetical protein
MPKKISRNSSPKKTKKPSSKGKKELKKLLPRIPELTSSTSNLELLMSRVKNELKSLPKPFHHLLSLSFISSLFSLQFPSLPNLDSKIKSYLTLLITRMISRSSEDPELDYLTSSLISEIKPLIFSLINEKLPSKQFFALLISTELFQHFHIIPTELVIQSIENFFLELDQVSNTDSLPTLFSLMTSPKAPFLPVYDHKIFTLVLDLDLTLGCFDGNQFLLRPGVLSFIEKMSKVFELVLFTAADQTYSDWAMKKADPGQRVLLRLYRQHMRNGIKDLQVLGRDLSKVVIIDDHKENLANQIENLIQITPWTGNKNDEELPCMAEALLELEGRCLTAYQLVNQINVNKSRFK